MNSKPNKVDLRRDRYTLQEAAEKLSMDIQDFFFFAVKGDIQIYVTTNNLVTEEIYELDSSYDYSQKLVDKALDEYQRQAQQKAIKVGPFIRHAKGGLFKDFYDKQWAEPQPVAKKSISTYYVGEKQAVIELDFNLILKLKNEPNERFVKLSPSLLVQDALDANKLFVMKADMQRLSEQSVNPDVAKPKISGVAKGPRTSTQECYAEWQRRAEEKKARNPALSAYAIATAILDDLEKEKSPFIRSIDTIRQHIKI
jgi:hypothetical protein